MARYVCCRECGFLQVIEPTWLNEAYSEAIAAADTGLVSRNIQLARQLTVIWDSLAPPDSKFVDVGAGTGLLVRLMRDRGFDYRWHDAFSSNVHARGFEAAESDGYFGASAIEVLEHLENPCEFLFDLRRRWDVKSLIATTDIYTGAPDIDWPYLAPETGQHVAFFTHEALVALAARVGWTLSSVGHLHVFADADVTGLVRGALSRKSYVKEILIARRRGSLTLADHDRIAERGLS
jgi:hypothetical protein